MAMNAAFLDYYLCAEQFVDFRLAKENHEALEPGYFRFGPDVVCYGRCVTAPVLDKLSNATPDVWSQAHVEAAACVLPFDPTEVVDNLRREHYIVVSGSSRVESMIRLVYYFIRP